MTAKKSTRKRSTAKSHTSPSLVRARSAESLRLIERARRICLAFPDANEKVSHGEPTWFAGAGKVFAMVDDHHHGSPHLSLWLPAPAPRRSSGSSRFASRFSQRTPRAISGPRGAAVSAARATLQRAGCATCTPCQCNDGVSCTHDTCGAATGVCSAEPMPRVPSGTPWKAPRAEQHDATSVEAWIARVAFGRDARAMLAHTIRMTFGVEPREMSLLHFLAWIASTGSFADLTGIEGGSVQDGIAGGAQTISQRLTASLGERLVLSAPVRRIAQDDDGVTLESNAGVFRARVAIVAVPPLLAGRIAYEPALPALRDGLTQRFPMGAAIKCVALYQRPFWRDLGFIGEAVGDRGPVGYVLGESHGEGGALIAFLEGATARKWSTRPAIERRRAVLADLAHFFGREAEEPAAYVEVDWNAEPWTLGCSAGVLPAGVLTNFGPALREPVGRLHWAGAETAREWFGFMEGAIESGDRATREVLARL